MRTIKFRGKGFFGRWHYGYLHLATGSSSLMIQVDSFDSFGVLPETVGQFTGLLDKNGKVIYEGDIIQSFFTKRCYVVFWSDTELSFMYKNPKSSNVFALSKPDLTMFSIIGNIHDNPELLKGGAE